MVWEAHGDKIRDGCLTLTALCDLKAATFALMLETLMKALASLHVAATAVQTSASGSKNFCKSGSLAVNPLVSGCPNQSNVFVIVLRVALMKALASLHIPSTAVQTSASGSKKFRVFP